MGASQPIENQQRSYEVLEKKHDMTCTTDAHRCRAAAVVVVWGQGVRGSGRWESSGGQGSRARILPGTHHTSPLTTRSSLSADCCGEILTQKDTISWGGGHWRNRPFCLGGSGY